MMKAKENAGVDSGGRGCVVVVEVQSGDVIEVEVSDCTG